MGRCLKCRRTVQIKQIYQRFEILPQLQQHMVRVAAVARLACTQMSVKVSENEIITACLLHDLGNLAKFDLSVFPQALEPEGLEVWQERQQQLWDAYGRSPHTATQAMLAELPVSERVRQLVASIGFDNVPRQFNEAEAPHMICEYGDDRVAPGGVVSLEERLADFEKRYGAKYSSPADVQKRAEVFEATREMEQYMVKEWGLRPGEITDSSIEPVMEKLWEWEI
jgi:hypothetical protein